MKKGIDYNFCGILAVEIFQRSLNKLDELQREFVLFQEREYHKRGGYRESVAQMVRRTRQYSSTRRRRQLKQHEYRTIKEMFCDRVPAGVIQRAIDEVCLEARQKQITIYSIQYFASKIDTYHAKHELNLISYLQGYAHPIDGGPVDWPWFYRFFEWDRQGNLEPWGKPPRHRVYDPWWGWRYIDEDNEADDEL